MPPSLRLAASVDLGRHAAQIQFIERRLHEGYRSRSRSLAQLNRRLRPKGPPIETIIDGMLAEGRTPSVLEIGFGWGRVLIELAERFRSRPVSLRGINRESRPPVERSSDLAAVAKALGLVPPGEIVDLPLPVLDFYDATALRLADESVDFAYSAVTIRFVEDKARLIEEVARVLRPGGKALLEIDEKHWEYGAGPSADPGLLADAPCRMVIHRDLELVPVDEYLAWAGGDAFAIRVARRRHCVVDITKRVSSRLDLRLELDWDRTTSTELLHVPTRHYNKGIRSVYTLSEEAMREFLATR